MASSSRDVTTSSEHSPHASTLPSMSSAVIQHEPTSGAHQNDEAQNSHANDHGHELNRQDHDHHSGLKGDYTRKEGGMEDHNIAIHASSKHAEMTLAPFLSEHIPTQYNPTGGEPGPQQEDSQEQSTNTKFCYRHRPDLKCRRQANEPSMEQLQNELGSLSQSDQQAISHVWSLFSAAPAKHRNLMLQGILTQCCFPQLSFISANIRDLIKIDFLSALPAELGFKILCYLDTTSLCKAAQVSQRWRSLADDDVVWHKMCEQHIDRKCTKCGWGLPLMERKRLRAEKRQVQLRATGRGLNEWSPDVSPVPEQPESNAVAESSEQGAAREGASLKRALEEGTRSPEAKKACIKAPPKARSSSETQEETLKRPWKEVYRDRFMVGTAWKYGRCSTKVFKGHTNGVMCLQFDDNILITGSYDTTVKVWDVNTGECLRTLKRHTMGVRCLQFDASGQLMTAGLNGEMHLWNWKDGTLVKSLPLHGDGILSLHYTHRFVASGSRDTTIRVFDNANGVKGNMRTFLLRGHRDWVNCVKIDEPSRTLFSASDDCTVKLWDLDTGECIRTFEGHVGQVQQVVLMPSNYELDDHSATPGERDDDASSVSSVTIAASHKDISRHREDSTGSLRPGESFWPNDPERPAPPRYMLTGALDCHIRLWDTHFRPPPNNEPTPPESHDEFEILPTDPLTNSHFPRAQACIRTFFGHVEGIWALSADQLRLVSGGEDRMMKIWDPRTGKCERTFTGHQGPVTCSWLSDSRVASGSEDCEVRMLCFGDE